MVKKLNNAKKSVKTNELTKDKIELAESSESEAESGEENSQENGEDIEDSEESESEVEDEDEEQVEQKETEHKVIPIKKPKEKSQKQKSKRGLLYIGRLPSGFEEKELKKYFEQFGDILNIRVARNKKSGNSKHYAFIEFETYDVAEIAQETMNNYMIFNHMLKCELLDENNENQEKLLQLFKGSEKKFRKMPWDKISKNRFDKAKSAEKWDKLSQRQQQKKAKKMEALKDAGFNFEL